MKILRYASGGNIAYGVLEAGGDIRALADSPFGALDPGPVVAHLAEVHVLAPVTPSKVFGVGSNF